VRIRFAAARSAHPPPNSLELPPTGVDSDDIQGVGGLLVNAAESAAMAHLAAHHLLERSVRAWGMITDGTRRTAVMIIPKAHWPRDWTVVPVGYCREVTAVRTYFSFLNTLQACTRI
jgi:hypothetical protein